MNVVRMSDVKKNITREVVGILVVTALLTASGLRMLRAEPSSVRSSDGGFSRAVADSPKTLLALARQSTR
jgi:hypothetical protein